MAKVKYDVSNVPSGGGGEQPQPGLYDGTVQAMTPRTEKADGSPVRDLEIVLNVGEGYANLWTYIKTPDDPNYSEAAHGWKLRELIDALGLKDKGEIDTAKVVGKPVKVKVTAESGLDGEYRGRARSLYPPGKITEDGAGLPEASDEEEPLTKADLETWTTDELREELEERGLTLEGRFSAAKAIAAILADQENGEETVADAAEEDADEEPPADTLDPELLQDLRTDADFYADWSDEDLKAYAEDLKVMPTGRKTRAKIVEAITTLAGNAEALMNGAGSESGEPTDDYDEWTADELNDEIATRNEQGADIKISGRKTKEKLIGALREDDKEAQPF